MSSAFHLSRDTVEQFRETAFVALLFVGILVFSIGGAFLVLGVAINTSPPSPYTSPADKRLLIGLSLVTLLIGGALIRASSRVVGW